MEMLRNGLLLIGLTFIYLAVANANFSEIVKPIRSNQILSTFTKEDVYDISRFIDDNFYHVQKFLSPYEPFPLKDIKISKYGELKNGQLFGLPTIRRVAECNAKYASQRMCTDLQLGWSELNFSFDYTFIILFEKLTGVLNGKVNDMKVNMIMCSDLQNITLKYEKFQVTKMGKIDIELSGSSASEILNYIGKLLVEQCKSIIQKIIDIEVANQIKDKVDKINELIEKYKQNANSTNILEMMIEQQYYNHFFKN